MPIAIETLNLGPLDNNSYVLACDVTHEAVVIDVGFEPEAVIDLVRRSGLRVRWLLGTTFAWHDVACYVVGVVAITAVDGLLLRPRPPRRDEGG